MTETSQFKYQMEQLFHLRIEVIYQPRFINIFLFVLSFVALIFCMCVFVFIVKCIVKSMSIFYFRAVYDVIFETRILFIYAVGASE